MLSAPFWPSANGVAVTASTASASISMASSPSMIVTNRSDSSAWVTWAVGSAPTAAFPAPGSVSGSPGVEIAPQGQVSIGTSYQNVFVAAVLLSGTGVVSFVPGEGL